MAIAMCPNIKRCPVKSLEKIFYLNICWIFNKSKIVELFLKMKKENEVL